MLGVAGSRDGRHAAQDDPDAALTFHRDTLGFEVRDDVGYQGMRWFTVGPDRQPGTSIVLYPPAATPGFPGDERRLIDCAFRDPGGNLLRIRELR